MSNYSLDWQLKLPRRLNLKMLIIKSLLKQIVAESTELLRACRTQG